MKALVNTGVEVLNYMDHMDPVAKAGEEMVQIQYSGICGSDMHAFLICGANKRLLFLPDHDSWQQTLDCHRQPDIRSWLRHLQVDIALLDGTFWSEEELGGRSQQDVPHPPVKQTLQMLGEKKAGDPEIIFIHLNHTNPLYDESSPAYEEVMRNGWKVGVQGQTFIL